MAIKHQSFITPKLKKLRKKKKISQVTKPGDYHEVLKSPNQVTLTYEVKMKPTSQQAAILRQEANKTMQAQNDFSQTYFNKHFAYSGEERKQIYRSLKENYKLKSQAASTVMRYVRADYRTVDKQLKKNPLVYTNDDPNDPIPKSKRKKIYIKRDINFLTKPINYQVPQMHLQRNRDWRFDKDNDFGITTSQGILHIPFNSLHHLNGLNEIERKEGEALGEYSMIDFFQWLAIMPYKAYFGGLTIMHKRGKWYGLISVTFDITDAFIPKSLSDIMEMYGIDRGVRILMAIYNWHGQTEMKRDKQIIRKRYHAVKRNQKLYAKHTKSANRAKKRISGRENRYASYVNHKFSKALVQESPHKSVFCLEDLVDMSYKNGNYYTGIDKRVRNSWAFYQLQTDLEYKAKMNEQYVLYINKNNTSQRCPICGAILKEFRDHKLHLFCCLNCGFHTNDDRVASMNICEAGIRHFLQDKKYPESFVKSKLDNANEGRFKAWKKAHPKHEMSYYEKRFVYQKQDNVKPLHNKSLVDVYIDPADDDLPF